ncbi:MAG: hypothetical protein JNN04_05585 [Cyclobacteriaceae bacterium]|nr:hypothetical protein [Cyclobacteriaceae bacterium]
MAEKKVIFRSKLYDRTKVREPNYWKYLNVAIFGLALGYLVHTISQYVSLFWVPLFDFKVLEFGFLLIAVGAMLNDAFRWYGVREGRGRPIGDLALSGDEIVINNEVISVSTIVELKVEIQEIKGELSWWGQGYSILSGTANTLEFTANGRTSVHHFELFSDYHLDQLCDVLGQLYAKGIFVKEFYRGGRTYLLESLGYDEIQAFKRKYGFS